MVIRAVIFSVFFLISGAVAASSLSAQLSDDSARFIYNGDPLGEQLGRLEIDAGLLYDDGDHFLAHAGLQVRGENLDAPVLVTLGARAYFGEAKSADVQSIGLGIDVNVTPLTLPGFEFGGHFYAAPEPVSFGDSTKLIDYGLRIGYQIIPLSTIFIGYEKVTVDIENIGEVVINKGLLFGIKLTF